MSGWEIGSTVPEWLDKEQAAAHLLWLAEPMEDGLDPWEDAEATS